MLKTRLWMGSLLIVLVTCVLLFDPAPWFPFLLVLAVFLAAVGSFELHQLLGASHGLSMWLSVVSVLVVLLANWPAHVWPRLFGEEPWRLIVAAFAAVVLLGFLVEMAAFRQPFQSAEAAPPSSSAKFGEDKGESGSAIVRLSLLVWITAYLGILPSFLVQLRWPPPSHPQEWGLKGRVALALVIFVPKFCDIGAYFTGRLLGRHPMSPTLSPKKTWEGLAGGLVLSAATAVAINRPLSVVAGGDLGAAVFGLVVGGAGVLGDLAESMIKRDCRCKDASQIMPGFGGVLDVIDSILFAAPIAYYWLLC